MNATLIEVIKEAAKPACISTATFGVVTLSEMELLVRIGVGIGGLICTIIVTIYTIRRKKNQ